MRDASGEAAPITIGIVAGEASGDALGATLIRPPAEWLIWPGEIRLMQMKQSPPNTRSGPTIPARRSQFPKPFWSVSTCVCAWSNGGKTAAN